MKAVGSDRKRGVLFDLDGVVVRTEGFKAQAHADTVRLLGGVASADLYRLHMGKSHAAVRQAFVTAGGITADPAEYSEIYRGLYRGLLRQGVEVVEGAVALVHRLRSEGFALAVVTSTTAWAAQYLLDKAGLNGCFEAQISADEVDRLKPDPAAYQLALKRLALREDEAVVIEDTETGIEAAWRARIPAIALRHEWNGGHDFSRADAVLPSLADVSIVIATIRTILSRGAQSAPA